MVRLVAYPPLSIRYNSRDFGTVLPDGVNTLLLWPEQLLWAVATVGRANFVDVLAHGKYSEYELIYRISMVLANLTRAQGNQLQKSPAFLHLDPSEKGSVSYFLGLAVCKLFAEALLGVPWLLHLDVYRDRLDLVENTTSRQRPDLIGRDSAGRWIVMESKGRTNGTSPGLLAAGKWQTQYVRSIGGQAVSLRAAAVTYFSRGRLVFDWKDPEGFNEKALDLKTDPEEYLRLYYRLIYNVLSNNESKPVSGYRLYSFEDIGFSIGLRSSIYEAYRRQQPLGKLEWPEKGRVLPLSSLTNQQFYTGTDGVIVGATEQLKQRLRYSQS